MSKMKYSEVEWIGDIPDEWSLNKLRYIYNIKGGNGFSDEFQGNTIGDIPFVNVVILMVTQNMCTLHKIMLIMIFLKRTIII